MERNDSATQDEALDAIEQFNKVRRDRKIERGESEQEKEKERERERERARERKEREAR